MTEPAAPPASPAGPETKATQTSALAGFFWSAMQSWGSKLTQFVVFLVLARLLSPSELGLAASSAVVLLLASQIAEFGFGDAIVQARDLDARAINGPFFFSIGLACCITAFIYAMSGPIERVLHVPGVGAVLAVSSGVAPLTTLSLFQEAINRRAFSFRKLALRAFFSQLGGGLIGIVAALLGCGVWSLIIQAYAGAIISNIWMWRSAIWTPSFDFELGRFGKLLWFGLPILLTRVLDFITSRALDITILTFYGVAALGLYTAGSRIYLMLLQLLQQVVSDVALAYLSRISDDRHRMGETYLRTSLMSAYFGSPVFFLCAAVAPEMCVFFFGNRWLDAATLSQPLLFLGAVQCIQFVNGSYLASVGKPHYTLYLNIAKAVVTLTSLIIARPFGIVPSVICFCLGQFALSPVNFLIVAVQVRLKPTQILANIGPLLVVGAVSVVVALVLRQPLLPYVPWVLPRGIVLGAAFGATYVGLSALFLRDHSRRALAIAREQCESSPKLRKMATRLGILRPA